ncbi:tRNA 2-thiocytidine biosynthesis protein TtcA, partial [Candidatus Woesearchaeota archaeon]
MKCSLCSSTAVFSNPALCPEHLIQHVQQTALETIEKHSLFSREDRVAVAASGGKDSVALLDVLSSLGFNVSALAIDEGISSYRDSTLDHLRSFCSSRNIPLRIVSFADEYGASLDAFVSKNDVVPCRVCGVFRRQLLNKHSHGFDALATGHNLDDELQNIFLNLLKNNIDLLARLGPRTGVVSDPSFVPRVKPFYFLPEKMIRTYVILRNIDVDFVECPYAR